MNDIRCLIISSSIDYSTDMVCLELEARKIPYFRINRDQFAQFNIAVNVNDNVLTFATEGEPYIFRNKPENAIYFRAPTFLRTYNKNYSLEEQVYHSQWSAFIRNLIVFDTVRWINNPVETYRAENKMYQLSIAKKCGLSIPKTFAANTNQLELGNKLFAVKSIDTAIFNTPDQEMFSYTALVSERELKESDLSLAPVCIQEYLENKIDIRVTYVSGHMFPVKILKNNRGINEDWRKTKKEDLQYHPFKLPCDIEKGLNKLMQYLNLEFGGIDLIESNGSYYFIEINPTGEWCWLQENTGIDICKAIVNSLLGIFESGKKNG